MKSMDQKQRKHGQHGLVPEIRKARGEGDQQYRAGKPANIRFFSLRIHVWDSMGARKSCNLTLGSPGVSNLIESIVHGDSLDGSGLKTNPPPPSVYGLIYVPDIGSAVPCGRHHSGNDNRFTTAKLRSLRQKLPITRLTLG